MPVASMSIRLRIGGTQMFESPGTCTVRSSSSTSLAVVIPGRHSSRGLNWIVVSIISIGAGSVAVSARPTLPNTRATSGTVLISRSVCCSSSPALAADSPGSAVGMYSRSPSSSGGMNSPPSCDTGHAVAASASAATTSVAFGQRQRRAQQRAVAGDQQPVQRVRTLRGNAPADRSSPSAPAPASPRDRRRRPSRTSSCRRAARTSGPPAPRA